MYSLIDGIRTGPGIQWPDGRRVAVMLTFDFEAETLRISNLARQGKEPDEQGSRPLRRERGNLALSEDAGHLRRQGDLFYPELRARALPGGRRRHP